MKQMINAVSPFGWCMAASFLCGFVVGLFL